MDTQRLRGLLEAATPGKWKYSPWHIEEGEAAVRAHEGWIICCTPGDSDAEFIAEAHNALPALLTRVEELQAALGELIAADDAHREINKGGADWRLESAWQSARSVMEK